MSREPNRNVYVGHRYVPKIMGEWDKSIGYEGLSIVLNKGASYTSKGYVPVGIDILNEKYWALTGNYNAQVDHYRSEVASYLENVDTNTSNIAENSNDINTINDGIIISNGRITTNEQNINTNTSNIEDNSSDINTINEGIIISNGRITDNEQDINDINEKIFRKPTILTDFDVDDTGAQDSYNGFINALDHCSENSGILIVPKGSFLISHDEIIQIKSNIKIIFIGTINYLPGRINPLFEVKSEQNVIFENPRINGNFDGFGNHSETAHAISIRSAKNILINNPVINNVRGDGVYVGRDYTIGSNPPVPSDITIKDSVIHNSKRNGIALTSGHNVLIDNVNITSDDIADWNISGALDIEPNNPTESFNNVMIRNVNIKARLSGSLRFLVGSGKEPLLFDNINIENVNIESLKPVDKSFVVMSGGVNGTININNIKLVNTSSQIYNLDNVNINNFKLDKIPDNAVGLNLTYLNGDININNVTMDNDEKRTVNLINISNSKCKNLSLNNIILRNEHSEGIKSLYVSGLFTIENLIISNSFIDGTTEILRTNNVILSSNILGDLISNNGNAKVIEKNSIIKNRPPEEEEPLKVGNDQQVPENVPNGFYYYNTTRGKPIWYFNGEWRFSDGSVYEVGV